MRRAADENLPSGRVIYENVSGKALAAGPSVAWSYPPLAFVIAQVVMAGVSPGV